MVDNSASPAKPDRQRSTGPATTWTQPVGDATNREAGGPDPLFLSDQPEAGQQMRRLAGVVVDGIEGWVAAAGARSGIDPVRLADGIATLDPCPDDGVDPEQVLAEVSERVLAHGVRTFDPRCAAHLHCPTLLTAAMAELAIGATNQSMDSYDQAPAATLVEDHLVRWLAGRLGLPTEASGVLTSGGTASNLLGLLLARDHAAAPGWSISRDGLPPGSDRWRIVTSEAAHFSVQKAAALLGLGHRGVIGVAADSLGAMDLAAYDSAVTQASTDGCRVIAVVGTAGTTDLGAIDPLVGLAERAAAIGAWFHVDAAVGGAFCLSDRLRPRLAGLERADSVTADLHKLWWQPIGASALLVRDAERLAVLRVPSDYLDRPEDDDTGQLNLVQRSLDTSRRFDALKILVSLRSTGRRRLGAMVEHLVDLAAATGAAVVRHPDLELLTPPTTVTVLFRWNPPSLDLGDTALDTVNTGIQRSLFDTGQAVIGRTRHQGQVVLKLTLVNPRTTAADLAALLDLVAATGHSSWAGKPLHGADVTSVRAKHVEIVR